MLPMLMLVEGSLMRSISLTYPMTSGGKTRATDASDFVRRIMSRTCAACDEI